MKKVLARSSLKAPVFSNFFLNLLSALSIDSLSLILITIIILLYLLEGRKYINFNSYPKESVEK